MAGHLNSCPKCGVALVGDALAGLCPGCALEGALELGNGPEAPEGRTTMTRLGDYELLEEIARGGMGVVFRARQTSLDRIVAVKLILFGQFSNDAAVKRFRAEAAAAAKLQHPNIVTIHEVGAQDGQPFFSMDYVEGRNLDDFVRENPFTARDAARMLQTIARAIHYAHQQGIIHRDLKPSNILIDARGQPRVTDFGLAKVVVPPSRGGADDALAGPRTTPTPTPTISGQLLGSPNFMPPEQASARRGEVGPWSDVYSLGAILYCLLTARPPFASETVTETLHEVVNTDPIPPRRLNPSVPSDLETICLKCLEKEPARRYGTAQALADDLARFLRDEPIAARPVSRGERLVRWCRRKPVVAGLSASVLLLLALGFAGVLWQLHRAHQRAELDRQRLVRLNVAAGVRLMDQGDLINALPWLSHALQLDAGHPDREAIHRLRLTALLNRCPRMSVVMVHEAQVTSAEFSPDGTRIVTASRDRTARVWDAVSGEPITAPLRHQGVVRWAAFAPDGRHVATASADKTAAIWDIATGRPAVPPLVHSMDTRRVLFSLDGRRLMTLSGLGRQTSEVRLWDVASGRPVAAPMTHALEVQHAVFSPDGRRIATGCGYTDSTGEVWVWDPESGKPIAGPARHQSGVYRVAFSPDGEWILAAGGNVSVFGEVHVWDNALRRRREPGFSFKGQANGAAFSPDGLRVLTGGYDRQVQVWDPATGEALMPPLRHDGIVFDAAFSPDGRWIVTACADLTARLWDAGTGEPIGPALPHLSGLDSARFSPDGRRVLTFGLEPVARVWEWPAPATVSTILRHDYNLRHASFSPDSTRVATATGLGQCRIWETATGRLLTELRHHTGLVWRAVFSPDGSRVATSTREQGAVIWDATAGRMLAQVADSNAVPDIVFSPDGRRLATAGWRKTARVWDATTGEPVTPPLIHEDDVDAVEFSHDGQWLLTTAQGAASTAGQVRLWEMPDGRPIPHSMQHRDRVIRASFSPDGRRVVTASRDQTARVWEFGSWQPRTPPLRHNGPVTRAFFSPDGRRVVTASIDATARIWDAATGEPVTPPLKHKMDLFHVAWSPDSQLVATASWDGTARVWDAATGEAITPFLRHDNVSRNPVEHVAFSPDGRWVLTASWDNTARLWPLRGPERPVEWVRFAQVQSSQRISGAGEVTPLAAEELLAAWREARSQDASNSDDSRKIKLAWHRQQADDAEAGKDWFAAQWHLNHLVDLAPEEEGVRQRRQTAAALAAQARDPFRRPPDLPERLPPRPTNARPELIDLSLYFNAALTDAWHSPTADGNNLGELPRGVQTLGGVQFDVRGLIQLAGTGDATIRFPKEVRGIKVGRTCRRLHFLHATIYSTPQPDGVPVGRYIVHYAGGLTWEMPILYGRDLRDWWTLPGESPTTPAAEIVWTGRNPSVDKRGATLRLFKRTWEVPATDLEVESIDFLSSTQAAAPFLIAITAE